MAELEPNQEKILLELEMILTTVKQIDSNLDRSIGLLQNPIEAGQAKTDVVDHNELVRKNTQIIKSILETLGELS